MISMALIKCPECGRDVSDRAQACPQCGYPIAAPVQVPNRSSTASHSSRNSTVAVSFPDGPGFTKMKCKVWDSNGNVIAECREGGVASFPCSKTMTVTVGIPMRYFNKPEITVSPGDRLRVYDKLGKALCGVSKVDAVF